MRSAPVGTSVGPARATRCLPSAPGRTRCLPGAPGRNLVPARRAWARWLALERRPCLGGWPWHAGAHGLVACQGTQLSTLRLQASQPQGHIWQHRRGEPLGPPRGGWLSLSKESSKCNRTRRPRRPLWIRSAGSYRAAKRTCARCWLRS